MKITIAILSLSASFLFACNSSTSEDKAAATDTSAQYAAPSLSTETPAGPAEGNTQATAPATNLPEQSQQSAQATGSSAPNPAHGQPGHRCDIAVGAPLNSKPTAPQQGQQMQQQAQQQSAPLNPTLTPGPTAPTLTPPAPTMSAPTQPTAAGMNPPHGQPGHDCAIPVGQPLKK
jgi:hypothetical protein